MRVTQAGLVEILREFLDVHQLTRSTFAAHRGGQLRFVDLEALIGDDDRSALFRLKERCHALLRPGPENAASASHQEALVDLAVGSLFHEAMKFRENFYQREVYGPRVRELQSEAGLEEKALFDEFEHILGAVSRRLEEGLREAEALLDQTSEQLVLLLSVDPSEGLVSRTLTERTEQVERVFGVVFDDLLARIHGSAVAGYVAAGSSYLSSGYYSEAVATFDIAADRGGDVAEIARLRAYARGMAAYLDRDYGDTVAGLREWSDSEGDDPPALGRLAREVLSRIGQLASGEERERLVGEAAPILARLPTLEPRTS